MELTHGGDITGFLLRYGRPPIDFSASLNPFGMPAGVAAAARQAVDDATPYPDPLCRELTAALALHLDVDPERIFCGNGAADIIFRLVLALRPRRALVPAPSFAEYEEALRSVDCEIQYHLLDEARNFAVDETLLSAIQPGLDLLFLCQPNNPTGQAVDPDLLPAVLDRCEKTGVTLVMDECFCEFIDAPARHSLLHRIADHKRLFILGSFTKLYGMAGIRLGYGVAGDPALPGRLRAAGQPWAVSNIALAAGLAALREKKYVAKSLQTIRAEKQWLLGEFARLDLPVIGSAANYLFFFTEAPDFGARLAEAGILVRDCANFKGLRPGYYRVAVRLRKDNERLIEAMTAVLRG